MVLLAKFTEGAWITALLVAVMIVFMHSVKRHYVRVDREVYLDRPIQPAQLQEPIVVVPIDRWSRITEKALSFALSMSNDIRCLHVQVADDPDEICKDFDRFIADPLKAAGKCVPKLEILQSPYRYVLQPMVDYILKAEKESEVRKVCVLVPELVVLHWWENLLHNRRANLLKAILLHSRHPAHHRHQYSLVSRARMIGRRSIDNPFAIPRPILFPSAETVRMVSGLHEEHIESDGGSAIPRATHVRSCARFRQPHAGSLLALAIAAGCRGAGSAASESGRQANPSSATAVHGIVRNGASGDPLPRALVRINGDASTGVLTDGDGRFEIADVPDGPQEFTVVKPGFMDQVEAGDGQRRAQCTRLRPQRHGRSPDGRCGVHDGCR